ncbi:protein Flattop [Bufo gargarizans]|uniref:protein Flattop n=1 Tax=Bufo gargarizans TaxID=30331 RepID=UPI001CF1251A|nr:protein Flattop [Bufo gargarizans]
MATYYSANQYDSAFSSTKLQNWNVPKPYTERPSTHDGFTQFISDNRGHLLPGVPRSKTSPWGTYIGTWDMPSKIPPTRVSLTSRTADASRRLTEWIQKSESLVTACNGLRPDVTGKVSHQKEDHPQEQSRGPSQRSDKGPHGCARQPGPRQNEQRDHDAGSGRALQEDPEIDT